MLQENLDNETDVVTIFTPNAALANAVWDLRSLASMGGPGNIVG